MRRIYRGDAIEMNEKDRLLCPSGKNNDKECIMSSLMPLKSIEFKQL